MQYNFQSLNFGNGPRMYDRSAERQAYNDFYNQRQQIAARSADSANTMASAIDSAGDKIASGVQRWQDKKSEEERRKREWDNMLKQQQEAKRQQLFQNSLAQKNEQRQQAIYEQNLKNQQEAEQRKADTRNAINVISENAKSISNGYNDRRKSLSERLDRLNEQAQRLGINPEKNAESIALTNKAISDTQDEIASTPSVDYENDPRYKAAEALALQTDDIRPLMEYFNSLNGDTRYNKEWDYRVGQDKLGNERAERQLALQEASMKKQDEAQKKEQDLVNQSQVFQQQIDAMNPAILNREQFKNLKKNKEELYKRVNLLNQIYQWASINNDNKLRDNVVSMLNLYNDWYIPRPVFDPH